jgi:hypothetical protein
LAPGQGILTDAGDGHEVSSLAKARRSAPAVEAEPSLEAPQSIIDALDDGLHPDPRLSAQDGVMPQKGGRHDHSDDSPGHALGHDVVGGGPGSAGTPGDGLGQDSRWCGPARR